LARTPRKRSSHSGKPCQAPPSPVSIASLSLSALNLTDFNVNTLAIECQAHVDELADFGGEMLDEGGNNGSHNISDDDSEAEDYNEVE